MLVDKVNERLIHEIQNTYKVTAADIVRLGVAILSDVLYEGDQYENSIRALRNSAISSLEQFEDVFNT